MKRKYEHPLVSVENVRIEKGFAASASSGFNLDQFEYDNDGSNPNNSAW